MAAELRKARHKRFEPARIQYGAWDDPRVSLFATVPQQPIVDMLTHLKPLPADNPDRVNQEDACPLVLETSKVTSRLYREVKYQVQQIADDRNKNYHPIQERERQSALISSMMAEHNRHEFAEAMRRKQLHKNAQRMRDLKIEIDRAKTTLSVVGKRNENMRLFGAERAAERQEALEHREQVREEKLAEQKAMQQKARDYSSQLVEQIQTRRVHRDQLQKTEGEEGRQKRRNDELAHATDLKQAREWRHEKRIELKQMLDEFAELQRSFRNVGTDKKDKLDVIIMEAMGPVTASFIRKELLARQALIDRRSKISDGLGQELRDMKRKKDAHESMLADILACELQAKEKKRAHQDIEKRHQQKLQVAQDLIGQRKEQEFYRDKDETLYKTIPRDSTSFMERQYQQAADREAACHTFNVQGYEAIASDIVNNARQRVVAIEEDRAIRQALHDMEADMERRVDEERMRVLHAQPKEIIDELRTCKLSYEERHAFGLAACGMDDQPGKSH